MTAGGAQAVIDCLGLAPHPEGGWYRETWRAPTTEGQRATATAIHFLLEADQTSHWHRVDANEIWFWHAGAPLALRMAASEGDEPATTVLGADILAGQAPQARVPEGFWQAAVPQGGWVLVSCVVSPGFEFSGFELAPPDWQPGR